MPGAHGLARLTRGRGNGLSRHRPLGDVTRPPLLRVEGFCLGNRRLSPVWSCRVNQAKKRRGALLLATLLVVIFAVFAMHVLTSHERAPVDYPALPLAAEAVPVEHDNAHAEPGPPPADTSEAAESWSHHDDGKGVAELCMGLLCIMAALIALALSRGVSRRIRYVVRRWIGPRIATLSRSARPPCLHRLSILRC